MKYITICLLLLTGSMFASYLTQDEIKTFYEQGYYIKKSGLTPAELDEMDMKSSDLVNRVLEEIQRDVYPCLSSDQKIYVDGTQVVFIKRSEDDISILRLVGCESIEPAFRKVISSEKMKQTYFNLLKTDKIEQLVSQFHPKKPGDGVTFIKHRDIRYRKAFDPSWEDVAGNGSYAVCITAIDPMSSENGGIVLDRKSYPVASSEEDIIVPELEPGDMLFMHPEILHWSGENNSHIFRRALLGGFCVYGANHKNYPGDCTNDVSTLIEDEIIVEAAPWKKIGDTDF